MLDKLGEQVEVHALILVVHKVHFAIERVLSPFYFFNDPVCRE